MSAPGFRSEASALVFLASILFAGLALVESVMTALALIARNILPAGHVILAGPFTCLAALLLGIIPSLALYRRSRQKLDRFSLMLSGGAFCVIALEALLLYLIAPAFSGIALG
jgi:hypothetical protein